MPIKAAVFDVDGTLLDTESFQWQGWVEVLRPFGIDLSKEAYHQYTGKHGEIIAAELVKEHRLGADPQALLKQKERLILHWMATKELRLLPFAQEAIAFFRNRDLPVAVASSGQRDETEMKLQRTGLLSLFSVVVCGGDPEVKHGKPSPDIYQLVARKLGLQPDECIAFEDTQYGVEAAKGAGLICFAVPNQFAIKQDFSKADGVFASLQEAIDEVQKRYRL